MILTPFVYALHLFSHDKVYITIAGFLTSEVALMEHEKEGFPPLMSNGELIGGN